MLEIPFSGADAPDWFRQSVILNPIHENLVSAHWLYANATPKGEVLAVFVSFK